MRTIEAFAGDILVNNVGLAGATITIQAMRMAGSLRSDAVSASRVSVAVRTSPRGGGPSDDIASIYGRESVDGMTYNAVKAAEISLRSRCAAAAKDNIRVNSVAPDSTLFPGGCASPAAGDPAGIAESWRESCRSAVRRPEEIRAVVRSSSRREQLDSGASVPVDGCQSRSLI